MKYLNFPTYSPSLLALGYGWNTKLFVMNRNLQRQLAEVEALRSIYCGEGEFDLEFDEEIALKQLDEPNKGCLFSGVSFGVHLKLWEEPVSVHFAFPEQYPELEAASVTVRYHGSVISRSQLDYLNSAAESAAKAAIGEESSLQVLQILQDLTWQILENVSTPAHTTETRTSSASEMCGSLLLKRQLFWFHHIKSTRKRKCIVEWGKELQVGGYCKPGFPGVLIIEAEDKNITEYVRRVRRLRWQAMNLRALEEEHCPSDQNLDDLRRFKTDQVEELEESDMSKLAALCREAKLEHMFLTALKLSAGR